MPTKANLDPDDALTETGASLHEKFARKKRCSDLNAAVTSEIQWHGLSIYIDDMFERLCRQLSGHSWIFGLEPMAPQSVKLNCPVCAEYEHTKPPDKPVGYPPQHLCFLIVVAHRVSLPDTYGSMIQNCISERVLPETYLR